MQGQVNQLNSDVTALIVERNSLRTEMSWLINARDEAIAKVEAYNKRWALINHQEHDDGSRITFSGTCVNTGFEDLHNIQFHVTGYDMTSNLVVDLYVGDMTIISGYYFGYHEVVDYAPLALSEWDIELVYEE